MMDAGRFALLFDQLYGPDPLRSNAAGVDLLAWINGRAGRCGLAREEAEELAQDAVTHLRRQLERGVIIESPDTFLGTWLDWRANSIRRRRKGIIEDPEADPADPNGGMPIALWPMLDSAYAQALAARIPRYREHLELAWRRFRRAVEEGRTLASVMEEEAPGDGGAAENATRQMARMREALLPFCEPEYRVALEHMLSTR